MNSSLQASTYHLEFWSSVHWASSCLCWRQVVPSAQIAGWQRMDSMQNSQRHRTRHTATASLQTQHKHHAALQDGEQDENIRQVQAAVRWAWLYVFMPLLFCLIGTGIDFATETSSTISDACAIVFSGV
jgi:hypothetical protein